MTEKRIPSSPTGELQGGVSRLAPPFDGEIASANKTKAAPPSEKRIASSPVRDLCGGISDMTLWRWLKDPNLGFPKPIYISRRRYWREADILAWLDAQTAEVSA